MAQDRGGRPEVGQVCWVDEELAELSLLLPAWQAAELERLASTRHLTSGQLLRLLITDFLSRQQTLIQRVTIPSPPVLPTGRASGLVAEAH